MSEKHFPMLSGASVPWSVLAPHEAQALRNHAGQNLAKLASRGGLGAGEAWCIVNDIKCPHDKPTWDDYEAKWKAFAERVNLHFEELESLRKQNAELTAKLEAAHKCATCGNPMPSHCPRCQRQWES